MLAVVAVGTPLPALGRVPAEPGAVLVNEEPVPVPQVRHRGPRPAPMPEVEPRDRPVPMPRAGEHGAGVLLVPQVPDRP